MNKRNPYIGLLAILVLALFLITPYAILKDEVKREYVTAEIAHWIDASKPMPKKVITAPLPLTKAEMRVLFADSLRKDSIKRKTYRDNRVTTLLADTTYKGERILLIGDSMIEELMFRFEQYAAFNGHNLESVVWYSSSSRHWGGSDTLSYFIKEFKPTYVLISCGANELFVNDVPKKAVFIDHIISQMGTIPYIWIGPPNWKQDTGIHDLIESKVPDGQFFLSKNLTFQRKKDGAHPNKASSVVWCDTIARWIMEKSTYPIPLNMPASDQKKLGKRILLQPAT